MNARPRLLFIVNVDWFFASHRLPIAEAALRQGFEVHLACATTGLRHDLEARGIRVHELRMGRGDISPIAALATIARIMRLLRSVRPDMVHLVTIKPVLLGGIAARLIGARRVVAAISGMGYIFISKGAVARARRGLVRLLYRLALGSPSILAIFQNRTDAELVTALARLRPNQVRMIRGSGVDLSACAPRPLPQGPAVVTFAARLLADKGLREFVAAAHLLKSQGVDARFVVAGDPDPDNPASVDPSEMEAWRRSGVVELVGHAGDVANLFARSHVVVLPSYREGLPKVLIEAAACGRAVVTTDVPGCRDAVTAGETALLVPPATVEPLAEAMRILIEDRERCAAMGAAGRELAVQAFGIERVVDAHLAIYQELMEQAP